METRDEYINSGKAFKGFEVFKKTKEERAEVKKAIAQYKALQKKQK